MDLQVLVLLLTQLIDHFVVLVRPPRSGRPRPAGHSQAQTGLESIINLEMVVLIMGHFGVHVLGEGKAYVALKWMFIVFMISKVIFVV